MPATSAASAADRLAGDLPKNAWLAAATPRRFGPKLTRFMYSSRTRGFDSDHSMRSASAISPSLPQSVRRCGRTVRASCIVSVEPPETMRRCVSASHAARARATGSTPA